ncbi:hypothetical protein KKH27_10690 [bacterium]|nr:hypothetical protein [bacterium]MBU1982936.1 hypothetical protein [bacterium]
MAARVGRETRTLSAVRPELKWNRSGSQVVHEEAVTDVAGSARHFFGGSSLPTGFHFLHVEAEAVQHTHKLLVMR